MNAYLTQAVHRALQQRPDAAATVFGSRRRTWREFADRVARLAGALQQLGMKRDDRVGMLALNSDRYLEYYYAVMWGGGVANPCNTRWSVPEIVYSLDDCTTTILLIDDAFLRHREAITAASRSVKTLIYVGDGEVPAGMASYEAILGAASPVADAHRSGEDLAGVFYTGGTTGSPKGVMLTHSNIYASALALSAAVPHTAAPVFLHAAPMFHMADTAGGMTYALRGATHTFIPTFTPAAMLQCIEDARVTATLIVPTMVQMTVDSSEVARFDTSSVTDILYGASAISEAVLQRALKVLPGARFTQAYGMTELSPVATILGHERHTLAGPLAGKLRAAGCACEGTEVKIFAPDETEVARGTIGEICVRGPHVMKGYWNQPALTAETLRGGWMHTGDGGYMDDEGFVFVVDRIKDMIVSGGENVYSAEVENALMQHPAIMMCAVIAVPDARWGERVHAVLVAKPGAEIREPEIVEHCAARIAKYKCPRSIEVREALPISGAGKILKKELREPYWRGVSRGVG